MYKDRITKWRLDKKNKQSDMLAILRKKTARDAVGKLSSFRVRGRSVTIEDVLHYFKRKKSVEDEDAYNAPTPSDVSCRTPSPVPVPPCPNNENLVTEMGSSSWRGPLAPERDHYSSTKSDLQCNESNALVLPSAAPVFESEQILQQTLEDIYNLISDATNVPQSPPAPQSLLASERLFFTTKAYFDGNFERGTWITDDQGHCTLSRTSYEALVAPFAFRQCCFAAVTLLQSGQLDKFRRTLAQAFHHIDASFRLEHPRTLDVVLGIRVWLQRKQHTEIVKLLLGYIVNLSTAITPRDHPWFHIWQLIGMIEEDSIDEALIDLWRCITDSFDKNLGQFHNTSLWNRISFFGMVYSPRDAETLFRKLLAQWEDNEQYGTNSRTLDILVYLVNNLFKQNRFAEAEKLGLDAICRAENPCFFLEMIALLQLIAMAQRCQNKQPLAENNLRRAIQIASNVWHITEPVVIDLMARLEYWLRGWGRNEEADRLRAEIDAAIGRDETDEELDAQ